MAVEAVEHNDQHDYRRQGDQCLQCEFGRHGMAYPRDGGS
jgi:hypothetical protein